MELDLTDLRLFLQVAEAGSITHGARHAHLALAAASTFQQFLSYQASRLGLGLRIRVRLPTFEGICRMVEHRVGLAIVPESAAVRYQKSMELRTVNFEESW